MYNINWDTLRLIASPLHKRQPVRQVWFTVLISQVKALHASFYELISHKLYMLQFNGQIIYMEHILNNTFDNVLRRIWINNNADASKFTFIFNKVEAQPPVHLFNKWNAVTSYFGNDVISYQGKVYQAQIGNVNTTPFVGSTTWSYLFDTIVLFNQSDFTLYNSSFIVMVPAVLVYDTPRMEALINHFKLAGKVYTIQSY